MKRFLLCMIVILTILCGWFVYQKQVQIGPEPTSTLKYKRDDIRGATILAKEKEPPAIQIANRRNSQIKNFSCDNIQVKAWQGGVKLKLTASMYYEKDNKFRMITNSVFGKELDIGSNDNQFWFWSKRMRPQALYFADHKDFNKTRLRTPFNPKWMVASLGLDTIDISKCKTVEMKDKLICVSEHTNSIGEPITKMTYVNKLTNRVDGFLLVDKSNQKIASGEVLAWNGDLPQQILYVWFEENTSMLFDLSGQRSNTAIDPRFWQMPNTQPRIDMSKDGTNCAITY